MGLSFDIFNSGAGTGTGTGSVSGNVVIANISGFTIIALISGQTVNISGISTSGQVSLEYGTLPRTGSLIACTAISGGTQLPSGAAFSVTIRNISGNLPVYAGSTSTPPEIATPVGMPLYAGDSFTIKTDNLNKIRIAAQTSGNLIAWFSVQ